MEIMNFINIHFLLYFYLKILQITCKTVILKFNQFYDNSVQDENLNLISQDISFYSQLYDNILYTIINIGEPEFKIKTVFSFQHPYFALTPNKYNDPTSVSFSNYNFTKSNTFKNVTCPNQYYFESNKDILGEESLILDLFNYEDNTNKKKNINNMNIIIGINDKYKDYQYSLNIGLQIIMNDKNKEDQKYNFIYQLKEKGIINNYYWCLFFEKGEKQNGIFLNNPDELYNAKGKLIIGDLPSNYQSKDFHKSQLLSTYSYGKDSLKTWALEFNDIYYYNKNNKMVKDMYYNVHIDINNYQIQAPNSYLYHIKTDFFNEYISKGICSIYSGNGFDAINCIKSENFTIENLKQFPILYLRNNDLQYVFEFNYEDLFVEKDGNYCFLITFPTYNEIEEWFFGIIFLRKYNLIFNHDSKTISFYNPKLPYEEEDTTQKSNNNLNIKTIILIIIIVIIGIASIILGIYIGKIIYNKKNKKRFNELDDSFEYVSKDNSEENIDNNQIGLN
jgi:hypothetical protein